MNQLEQQKQEAINRVQNIVTMSVTCKDDVHAESLRNMAEYVFEIAYQAGQHAERESTNNIITKERDTWARESIGDKALQSLEIALINSKE